MSAHRLHRSRVLTALELAGQGHGVAGIAATMGCTLKQAERWLSEGIATLPEQSADDLRATSELRLDAAARVFSELLDSDDVNVRLRAAQGLSSVEQARSRMLGTWLKPEPDEVVA